MPSLVQVVRDLTRRRRAKHAEEHDDLAERRPATVSFLVAGLLIVVALALWVVWSVPHRVIQHRINAQPALAPTLEKQLDLEDAYRKTITQIVLSIFGLYILYLSARRAEAGDKTVRIMEQGHITDRFTKAIEQLGKTDGAIPNIEVRLGAIYALERIALDSPRDHWTIMEVLTAYVRQNAPLDPERPYTASETTRTDVQAILTVLGRRRTGPKRERPGQRLDLTRSRLCGANLSKADLQKAFLWGSNLQEAFLSEANLQEANLSQADLQKASLAEANLQKANLHQANLQQANLREADLQEAHLRGATLQTANLGAANLQKADLGHADLQGAYLLEANLEDAYLGNANMQEAVDLTIDQIKSAQNWQSAHYSPLFRAELGLPPELTEDQAPTSPTP